jgi:thiosulfate/3-mercaptopyruvate sulfurtransferase
MKAIHLDSALVEVEWLKEHIGADDLVVLDATLPKAVAAENDQDLAERRIPGARFFDIKNVFSDTSATFPNTWPGERAFIEAAKKLGINKNSVIVVYDDHGIYSSARAWWMFKAMGHVQVAVLNGGLVAWKKAGFEVEEKNEVSVVQGDFSGNYDPDFFKDHQDVLGHLNDQEELVIDARAEDRFKGLVEEPRKGLRSGHIPGSLNLPYTDLLCDGKMIEPKALKDTFHSLVPENRNLVFSCGSGITACVLALGAELAGYKHISVYDGSWTEWGSIPELPIEKGAKA